MNKPLLIALASVTSIAFIACDGEVQSDTKASIAQAIGAGESVDGDVCSSNGWNGDEVCDSWCPDGDVEDCDGDDVVCAAFIEESDGVCSRAEDDPCRMQDPDCDVACAEIAYPQDGVCELGEDHPCSYLDPDCEMIDCPAIAELPDGVCNEDPDEVCPTDPDCVACPEIAMEPNGVCELPATDPCQHIDPDCVEG